MTSRVYNLPVGNGCIHFTAIESPNGPLPSHKAVVQSLLVLIRNEKHFFALMQSVQIIAATPSPHAQCAESKEKKNTREASEINLTAFTAAR